MFGAGGGKSLVSELVEGALCQDAHNSEGSYGGGGYGLYGYSRVGEVVQVRG